jgi:hypothetical protein
MLPSERRNLPSKTRTAEALLNIQKPCSPHGPRPKLKRPSNIVNDHLNTSYFGGIVHLIVNVQRIPPPAKRCCLSPLQVSSLEGNFESNGSANEVLPMLKRGICDTILSLEDRRF